MKYMFTLFLLVLTGIHCHAEEPDWYKKYQEDHKKGFYEPDAKTAAWLQDEKRKTDDLMKKASSNQNNGGNNGSGKAVSR